MGNIILVIVMGTVGAIMVLMIMFAIETLMVMKMIFTIMIMFVIKQILSSQKNIINITITDINVPATFCHFCPVIKVTPLFTYASLLSLVSDKLYSQPAIRL